MKTKLTPQEAKHVIELVEGLLNDAGHAYSESISVEFDYENFKVEITASKEKP